MVSCPVCFGEFKNNDSLRVHHYKKHQKSEEDISDQDTSYDSEESSIPSIITNKKRKLCQVNETNKVPIDLLNAYNIKHNFFAILAGKEEWGTQEQIPVDDEKLLIDAVMATESLSDVRCLLNENIPICQKICNRVKSNEEK